jgi:hypothetical protein
MEPLYVGVSIAALVVTMVLLVISRRKGRQLQTPADLLLIGMTLVVLGIIFGDAGRLISYSFIGAGVLLGVVDGTRSRGKR